MKDFIQLISTIEQVHQNLQASAANAVNRALTIRNWLIGFYIVEFEQKGEDRAEYGESLLSNIAGKLKIKGLTAPELSRCRQFYQVYPQILGTLPQEFKDQMPQEIFGTAFIIPSLLKPDLQSGAIKKADCKSAVRCDEIANLVKRLSLKSNKQQKPSEAFSEGFCCL